MTETTVFQSGNSQAVRLPKEFRFGSKTVEIFRRGNEVVLREKPRTMAEVLASLPPATPEMVREIDEMMAIIRKRQPEYECESEREPEREPAKEWDALVGESSAPPTAAPKKDRAGRRTQP